MNKELTIHASLVKELYYYAIQQGAPHEHLITMTGLETAHFENLDGRIPLHKLVTLWHAAVELTQNPALGLQIGAQSDPKNAGIISLVCMNAPTLGEMLSRIIRYMRLIAESDRFELVEENECVRFVFQIEAPEAFTIYGIERTFTMGLNWINTFVGTNIKPKEVHFQYRRPDYIHEYDRIFSCPLFFEQEGNTIVFDKNILNIPAISYNVYLDELIQKQTKQLLDELGTDKEIKWQTQQLILKQLPTGDLNVDIISEKMNMSRRTLARKLKEENTSFQDLLEKTRKELATDYLKRNTLSINDIAFMLGFSESSAFSRAFKRWCGHNPQEYRNALSREII